jgi:hypothetical protein
MKHLQRLFFSFLTLLLPSTALAAGALISPFGGTTDIPTLVGYIVRAILGLSGVLALAMFIYGGIIWLTSNGNPTKITKGRDTLVWAALGLVVLFTAYTLVSTVVSLVGTGTITGAVTE